MTGRGQRVVCARCFNSIELTFNSSELDIREILQKKWGSLDRRWPRFRRDVWVDMSSERRRISTAAGFDGEDELWRVEWRRTLSSFACWLDWRAYGNGHACWAWWRRHWAVFRLERCDGQGVVSCVVNGSDAAMKRPCVVPMTCWQFERPNEYGRYSRSSWRPRRLFLSRWRRTRCVDGPSCGEYDWNAAGPCKNGDGIGDDQTGEECNCADVLGQCRVGVVDNQSSFRTLNPH